jgi:hypothetical protein
VAVAPPVVSGTVLVMARPQIIGIPGGRLGQLRFIEFRKALLHGGAALLLTVGCILVLTRLEGTLMLVAVVAGGCGALVEAYRFHQAEGAIGRLTAGWRAERRVGKSLRSATAEMVIHGAVIGRTGDCDHIVLGPCAAVVETKHGRGPVTIHDGSLMMRGRRLPRDPIAQAQRQARVAGDLFGARVTAVLCIAEMTNRPFLFDGVYVCNASDVNAVIAGLPSILRPGDAARLAAKIR